MALLHQSLEAYILELNKEAMVNLKNHLQDIALFALSKAEKTLTEEKVSIKDRLWSVTLNNIGCYYKKTGKLVKALSYFERALEMDILTVMDAINQAGIYLNICSVKSLLQDHRAALDCAYKSVEILSPYIKDSPSAVHTICLGYHNMGLEYSSLKCKEEAISSIQKGLDIGTKYLGSHNVLNILHEDLFNISKMKPCHRRIHSGFNMKSPQRNKKTPLRSSKVLKTLSPITKTRETKKNIFRLIPALSPQKVPRNNTASRGLRAMINHVDRKAEYALKEVESLRSGSSMRANRPARQVVLRLHNDEKIAFDLNENILDLRIDEHKEVTVGNTKEIQIEHVDYRSNKNLIELSVCVLSTLLIQPIALERGDLNLEKLEAMELSPVNKQSPRKPDLTMENLNNVHLESIKPPVENIESKDEHYPQNEIENEQNRLKPVLVCKSTKIDLNSLGIQENKSDEIEIKNPDKSDDAISVKDKLSQGNLNNELKLTTNEQEGKYEDRLKKVDTPVNIADCEENSIEPSGRTIEPEYFLRKEEMDKIGKIGKIGKNHVESHSLSSYDCKDSSSKMPEHVSYQLKEVFIPKEVSIPRVKYEAKDSGQNTSNNEKFTETVSEDSYGKIDPSKEAILTKDNIKDIEDEKESLPENNSLASDKSSIIKHKHCQTEKSKSSNPCSKDYTQANQLKEAFIPKEKSKTFTKQEVEESNELIVRTEEIEERNTNSRLPVNYNKAYTVPSHTNSFTSSISFYSKTNDLKEIFIPKQNASHESEWKNEGSQQFSKLDASKDRSSVKKQSFATNPRHLQPNEQNKIEKDTPIYKCDESHQHSKSIFSSENISKIFAGAEDLSIIDKNEGPGLNMISHEDDMISKEISGILQGARHATEFNNPEISDSQHTINSKSSVSKHSEDKELMILSKKNSVHSESELSKEDKSEHSKTQKQTSECSQTAKITSKPQSIFSRKSRFSSIRSISSSRASKNNSRNLKEVFIPKEELSCEKNMRKSLGNEKELLEKPMLKDKTEPSDKNKDKFDMYSFKKSLNKMISPKIDIDIKVEFNKESITSQTKNIEIQTQEEDIELPLETLQKIFAWIKTKIYRKWYLKQLLAAIKIQTWVRCYQTRELYRKIKDAVTYIQTIHRGNKVRKTIKIN